MKHYQSIIMKIDPDKCDGRMKCMRVCPTEAIRIRDGKAVLIEEKCIDCGECIKTCPSGAIIAMTDPFGELTKFRHTVAIPSPGLHAQFGLEILPNKITQGLKNLGFDDAYDLSHTCGEVSFAIQEYLQRIQRAKAGHLQRLSHGGAPGSSQIPLAYRSGHSHQYTAGTGRHVKLKTEKIQAIWDSRKKRSAPSISRLVPPR